MSALARYFKVLGKSVAGYDKTPSALTNKLIDEGIEVKYDDAVNTILPKFLDKENTIIVYTPAIPANHSELLYFKQNGFVLKKRSEVLGFITKNTNTIAVAGTHGKTTTSSLVAHLLKTAGLNISAFLGGITQNYNTNILIGDPSKEDHYAIVEADEYDRSFLTLYPDIAIVTSMDADHLDIYGHEDEVKNSYQEFVSQIKDGGKLIKKKGLPLSPVENKVYSYSLKDTSSNFYASNIRVEDGHYVFDLHLTEEILKDVVFGIPGLHNIENAVSAAAVAHLLKVPEDNLREGLHSFRGVKRRFEYYIKRQNLVLIDDYAHHPAEIKACVNSVKDLYRDKKITGIFQPHLFSRTRDFADDFARSLELLDEVILLDIYPARELPIEGVTSQLLLDKINAGYKKVVSKEELPALVKSLNPEVVVMMGAGDIDQLIQPVKQILENTRHD